MSMFGGDETPAGAAAPYDQPLSPDPECQVCGAPIEWSGRGRRPTKCVDHKRASSKSSGTTRVNAVSEKELNTACESLKQLYDMMVFPLAMIDPADDGAASIWLSQIDALDSRNRALLANNRPLVRKINAAGEKSGNLAFFASHVIAVAPVLVAVSYKARTVAAARRAERETQWVETDASEAPFVTPTPGGGVGGSFFDPGLDVG